MPDTVWTAPNIATMSSEAATPYGAISDGAIVVRDGRIAWIGPESELLPEWAAVPKTPAKGRWLTPGLIDCHTHIVYGGNRAREFEMRLEGATYEEIARAGGGIVSTVAATRSTSAEVLVEDAQARVAGLLSEGVTGIEIKSGYGLDTATEIKMLEVASAIGERCPVDISRSFLGAHALPAEYAGNADGYIAAVCEEILPAAHALGLVDAVDGFCESIAFDNAQMRRVFEAAAALNLPVKLHAEQLSDLSGAALVAEFGGLSADHLEYLSEAGVRALAASGTVAVLLPGAFYCLRETKLPPINALREHGVPIAIATDSNPGSSPVGSLLLMLSMACTLFQLTPEEALRGVTSHAAQALGWQDRAGTLEAGKDATFVAWDIETPAELAYRVGHNPCVQVVRRGRLST